jgi:hypothetical protein
MDKAAARLCATDEDVVDGDVNCVALLVPLHPSSFQKINVLSLTM